MRINISNKQTATFLFLATLFVNFMTSAIDRDVYVPAFPQMLHDLNTHVVYIQLILSVNFIAMCLGTLVYGSLSDSYGRKPILLLGLSIFALGSLGCLLSHTIWQILFFRFIQGLGSAATVILFFVILFERFSKQQAINYYMIINGLVTSVMALAPFIGGVILMMFSWSRIFAFIFALNILSLLMVVLFLDESLDYRRCFSLKNIVRGYGMLVTNRRFVLSSMIASLIIASIIIYVSNLSILLVDYMHVSTLGAVIHQSSIMLSFTVFSLLCPKLIARFGEQRVNKIGMSFMGIAALTLFILAELGIKNPLFNTLVMNVFSGAGALALGLFVATAMAVFPEHRGVASSGFATFRMLFMGVTIYIAGKLFDGTLMPVATIIFINALICMLANRLLKKSPMTALVE